MLKYIIKRILILIPVVIVISIMLFGISKMMPGDPVRAMLPTSLKADQMEAAYNAMYKKLGLDKPIPEQYIRWMGNLFHGEFGWSSNYNRAVKDVVAEPLRNTIILNIFVNLCYLALSIPIGIKCATKRGALFDNVWQVFSMVAYSMPSFFLALTLIYFFGIKLKWLPIGGMPNSTTETGAAYILSWVRHLVLPVVTLTIIHLASAIRYVRNAMIDALSQDYIRTARAKGLIEKVVVYSHAFRNALIPVSFVVVSTIFALFSGSAITETVFAYNGIGKLMIASVTARDTQMIITMNLFFSIVSIVSVLVGDIIYCLVDPRVKLS